MHSIDASAPDLEPIRKTISEAVADRLRAEIRSGALAPGSRLRQADVAERFRVSTTPVREAFATLEREGLVVSAPHRGVEVFHATVKDLQETYEIRIPLETLATELAVPNMTDEDLAELAALIEQMSATRGDPVGYGRLNAAFHARIYRCAERPKLERLIADLREASAAYLRLYATIAPGPEETHAEHTAIFDACRARAPKRAAKAMTAHLQHTVDFVSKGLAEPQPA
jgi:DNA-binding GntR family transcriptional regulator